MHELSQSLETQRAYDATMIRFRQMLAVASLDLDAEASDVQPAWRAALPDRQRDRARRDQGLSRQRPGDLEQH